MMMKVLMKEYEKNTVYASVHSLARFGAFIYRRPTLYKINSPVFSTHENLACLGSGVLQLRDSLLFSSLDLSAETNFEDKNISLIYGKHYVCKVTYSTLFCPPVHCA